jgi:hypothetical protein
MSVSREPQILAFKADGVLSKGMVVKAGSDGMHVAKSVLATSKHKGICQNDVDTAGDIVEVAMLGGGAKGLAGGTIADGDYLTADANGKLVATTTPGDHVIATAMESAVAGDIFSVDMRDFVL